MGCAWILEGFCIYTTAGKEQEPALVYVNDAVKDSDACGEAEGPPEASCV